MTQPPVLALPDLNKMFVIETYASGSGIWAMLIYEGLPLAFISKSLGPRQQVLSTYEKEMMAIHHAVYKWRHYLLGRHFKVRTNHVTLKYLMEQKITFPSHHLWLRKLLSLDFEIEYKKGKDNTATDTSSRNPKGELFTMAVSLVSTTLMNLIKAS